MPLAVTESMPTRTVIQSELSSSSDSGMNEPK